MAMDVQGLVGLGTYGDGVSARPRLDRTGALVKMDGGGKWHEATRLGQMFTYSTPAAGVAVPIYSSTTQQCVLWNPPGNNKVFSVKSITFGYVSGTAVAGHYCLAVQTLQTNTISGTQSAIVLNHRLSGNVNANGQNGQTLQLLTAVTLGAAATYFRALRLSQVVQAATATNAPWTYGEDVDGSILLMPGAALIVAANAAAFVTATVAIEGAELPVGLAA